MVQLSTPFSEEGIRSLKVFDTISITGTIFAGRDAVLPKIVKCMENGTYHQLGIDLQGSVIFHTAVSPAGIGPTSSNKVDIESSIPRLSSAGVKVHLGKGSLSAKTVQALKENNSVYAVTPPVTALFSAKLMSQKVAAFPEEGMEALYKLEVVDFPAIIAIAHGVSIFDKDGKTK